MYKSYQVTFTEYMIADQSLLSCIIIQSSYNDDKHMFNVLLYLYVYFTWFYYKKEYGYGYWCTHSFMDEK